MKIKERDMIFGLWLVLALSTMFRPLFAIDETRYVSVAWEMWHTGNFLVPHINGAVYSQKPPLLFWLIDLGWKIFGVNAFTARMTGPLFGLIDLFLTAHIARLLWPERLSVKRLTPYVLLAFPFWSAYSSLTMFDALLTCFVLMAAIGLLYARMGRWIAGWLLYAIGIGGGLLAKGPVVFVPVLPLMLAAPLWVTGNHKIPWKKWYAAAACAMLLGIATALAWAVPAALAGGSAYADALFWGQSTGRMFHSFAHSRPIWWYLLLLPLIGFPWIFWAVPLFRAMRSRLNDEGVRFCLAWMLPAFAVFSLISCKQVHYLLPLVPAAALLAADGLLLLEGYNPDRFKWPAISLLGGIGTSLLVLPLVGSGVTQATFTGFGGIAWCGLLAGAGYVLVRQWPKPFLSSIRMTGVATVLLLVGLQAGPLRPLYRCYDVSPVAERIAAAQAEGKPVAICPDKYYDQIEFAGRLKKPLVVLDGPDAARRWSLKHPDGYVVMTGRKDASALMRTSDYVQPFENKWIAMFNADRFTARRDVPDGGKTLGNES